MIELTPQLDEQTIRLDGRPVHYTARGPARAPLTLVGLNGLAGGGDQFWPLLGGVPATVRILLPDLPANGTSAPLAARHTVQGYADWLDRFLDQQHVQRAVLISIATGAPIGVRHAAQHPARVAGLIWSLPFLGRIALPPLLRPVAAYALGLPPLRRLAHAIRQNDALMHRIITSQPPAAIPELAERDIDHKQQAALPATGELLHDLMLMDSRTELRGLRVPLLILAAEHDAYSPLAVLQGIVRGRPERRLFVKWGAAHSWNETFIQDMQDQIRIFLAQLETPASAPASG